MYAEKETCCGLQLIWAVAIQTKIVLVESLEQLAGLAVAKVILALICAGSIKVDVDPRKVAGFQIDPDFTFLTS